MLYTYLWDGMADLLLKILPDGLQVDEGGDVQRAQEGCVADAGEL
jgi:hypothetical protein